MSSSPPANPAFSLLSCPHPPAPSRREGGILGFLMQGAPPLAFPGAESGGTYRSCHAGHPAGACLLPRLPTLPLACFPAPYPPSPLPPFPAGRGIFSFLMQGAPPLASQGAETGRHLSILPCRASGVGWLSSPPADPAFSLLFCPHPPSPLPGGKALGFPPTTEDTDARQPSATPTQINATPPSTNNIY